MVDVFISYPRLERERAELIKRKLEDLDLDIFYDIECIEAGANFPRAITRALDASKAILCCWSPRYFESNWCISEAREGLAGNGRPARIVPVCLQPFERTAQDIDFRHIQYLDLMDWSGQDNHAVWNRTLETLYRLVGRSLAYLPGAVLPDGMNNASFTPEVPEPAASRAFIVRDLRETRRALPEGDEGAIATFLNLVRQEAPNSGLEFEIERSLTELQRVQAESSQSGDADGRVGPTADTGNQLPYGERMKEALRNANAYDFLEELRSAIVNAGFEVRDFSEPEDRPYDPGQTNGRLGLLVRICGADFILDFSKTLRAKIELATTLATRSQRDRLRAVGFELWGPKNLPEGPPGNKEGRYEMISDPGKQIFFRFETKAVDAILDNLGRIRGKLRRS